MIFPLVMMIRFHGALHLFIRKFYYVGVLGLLHLFIWRFYYMGVFCFWVNVEMNERKLG